MSAPNDVYGDLPGQMRAARRWVLWRSEPGAPGKKPRKVPYYASGLHRQGILDGPDDVANLATFDRALSQLQMGAYTGLGFALGPDGTGNVWQGIDLDDLPERPLLGELVSDLPGYTESSPSGRGMHAIGYGRPFSTLASNTTGIEAYGCGRFFTVTADRAGIHPPVCLAAFVEGQLAPLHRGGSKAPPAATAETVSVPPETVTELRSALNFLRSDDYGLWIRIGHALKTLGDVGRELWLTWSQGSAAFNPAEAAGKWEGFNPTHTDYKAVFAESQRSGWVNPRSNAAQGAVTPKAGLAGETGSQGRVEFTFIQARDLLSKPKPIPWLIHGVFEHGGLAQLFGDSTSGKSFVALDWGCCIATGCAWNGHDVEKGAVFYIAGEGHAGIGRRLRAWELHNKESLEDAPFFVSSAPAALMDAENAANVARAVGALVAKHGPPKLIIIDTLARNLGNGEENSNADIGLFIGNIDSELRIRFGATVLIVHHTGHMEQGRARGASALRAAMDSEYRLAVSGDIRTLACTKAKESEPSAPMAFKLEQVVLDGWPDENGELMTSAVLVSCDEKAKGTGPKLMGATRIAYEALQAALADSGQPPNADVIEEFGHLLAPLVIVHEEVWRMRCYDAGISDRTQGAKQKAFNRARSALLEMDLIGVWREFYWRGCGIARHRTQTGQCLDLSPAGPDKTGHTPIGVSVVRARTEANEAEGNVVEEEAFA
jgi:putative DNA primase/helicase